ncbi:MAG TPA: 4-alpha-glucanotransferase [Myxococcota bacterium]|nr:4-alpha-glucanotransferase [Myxococcota bacterium]
MKPRARHAGVLLHPSSLPGPGPIGEIGPYAHAFLEWMSQAGLDTWQMLPLHPVGGGYSPYGSPSAFAADPRLISLEALVADGLLEPAALPYGQGMVDVELVEAWKMPLLRQAAARVTDSAACRAWVATQSEWLADWALYAVLYRLYSDGWWVWPKAASSRSALRAAREAHSEEIAVEEGLQYLFHLQWSALREHAKSRGIRLVGDIPIFVSGDGCDTWAHRKLFQLRPDGRPDPIAGVPPDYFSPTGQRWGNPVYRWEAHKADGFAWWKARIRRELDLVDLVRLDHFRGFAANWIIPAEEQDARNGQWSPGPGRALFDALRKDLGELALIAEDLGEITPDVEKLRDDLGLPGMKVLQFAFGTDGNHPFLPHNFGHDRWVVYTGTHDNETAVGWYQSADERVRHQFRAYTARDGSAPAWTLLREAWASVAGLAVAPMQDFLGLGNEARINTPGIAKGNWLWRLRDLPWYACDGLWRMSATYGRTSPR